MLILPLQAPITTFLLLSDTIRHLLWGTSECHVTNLLEKTQLKRNWLFSYFWQVSCFGLVQVGCHVITKICFDNYRESVIIRYRSHSFHIRDNRGDYYIKILFLKLHCTAIGRSEGLLPLIFLYQTYHSILHAGTYTSLIHAAN